MTQFPAPSPARLQCPAQAASGEPENSKFVLREGRNRSGNTRVPPQPLVNPAWQENTGGDLKIHSRAHPFQAHSSLQMGKRCPERASDLHKVPGKTAPGSGLNIGLPGEPALVFCFLTHRQCSDPTLRSQMAPPPWRPHSPPAPPITGYRTRGSKGRALTPSDAAASLELPRWGGCRPQGHQSQRGCLTFRKILVLPICQSSWVPSTASAMRWHVPRRSSWGKG